MVAIAHAAKQAPETAAIAGGHRGSLRAFHRESHRARRRATTTDHRSKVGGRLGAADRGQGATGVATRHRSPRGGAIALVGVRIVVGRGATGKLEPGAKAIAIFCVAVHVKGRLAPLLAPFPSQVPGGGV